MFPTRSRKGHWYSIVFVVPLFLSGGAGASNPEVSAERRDALVRAEKQPQTGAAAQMAQNDVRTIDIPSQPLSDALRALSRQTGLQFFADSDLTRGMTAPAVSGRMTADQALRRLLAGSGLRYRFTSAGAVTLEPAVAGPENRPGDETESGPLLLGEITVEGRLKVDPADTPFTTPGSSAYISREQIDRVQPSSPGDIFRTVPGVFSGASNDGNSLNINIRGAQGLNRVRTMVEGTQQETTGNRGYAGSDQRSYVDPEFIGGVDISKGPGTGPLGSGSTSGVVNIRLLEADDLVLEGNDFGLRIRGGIGSSRIRATCNEDSTDADCSLQPRGTDPGLRSNGGNFFTDDNWFGSLAAAHRSDRFEFVLAYARRDEGNYFAGENGNETFDVIDNSGETLEQRFSVFEPGQEVTNTSERTKSALFKGALRFDGGHSVHAGATYYNSQFGMAFPTNLTTFAPTQTTLNDVESKRGWLRYKWDPDNDLINFQANVWGTDIQEQGELRQAPQENESWGGEIWNTSFIDMGFGGLTMTYGAEYSRSNGIIDLDVPLNRTDYSAGQPPVVTNNGSALYFDGTREVVGGHFNAAFSPTDWFTLNAGVRYDRFEGTSTTPTNRSDVEFDNAAFTAEINRLWDALFAAEENCDTLFPDFAAVDACYESDVYPLEDQINNIGSRRDEFQTGSQETITQRNESKADRFSPNFGVTLEPLDGLQVFLRYAEGFRALSLVELGQSFAFGTQFDPGLEPEVLKTWEVGLNYLDNGLFFEGDVLRSKFVYFDNEYENFIGRPFEGAPFANYDDISVSGIETTLSYDMGHVFADLNLSYYTKLPEDNRTIASLEQPVYSGSLTTGTRWLDENLELGGRVTFFDERRPEFGDELGLVDVGRYWEANTIFDVFGSYRFNDHISIDFSVENLMDKYYLPPLYVNRMPTPGRTVRISATIQF